MWRKPNAWLLALVVAIGACTGAPPDPEPSVAPGAGADTAVDAVEELVDAIKRPDFAAASRLAMPGHAALAALAEGATFGEVAEALAEGDEEVAANFWAGFAQGAGDFLTGDITVAEGEIVTEGGMEFQTITVGLPEGGARSVMVREDDGYRVDLFASFGQGLADKMTAPTERLLTTQSEDAGLILAELQEIVPSLLVAASKPGTTPGASQEIIALIEIITRVS